ncbi:MAG: zinc-binding dehydrogenase [Promethearchaeota archaeon]
MKAAVFEDIKKIMYKENYPKPTIGSDDVLVKVHYCGICGSDITNFKYKMYQVPLVMGHEIAGKIAEIGNNISEFKIGERVVCFTVALDIGSSGLKGLGTFQDGGFAEYVKAPKEWIFKIPKTITMKEAVLFETFALAMRAFKLAKIGKNENILIFGGGRLGLTTLKALKVEKDPNYVVVIEPNEYLRNKALKMGANYALPPRRAKIKKIVKKIGEPTFIFDSVGNKETLSDAIFLLKKGGTILLEGIHKESIIFSFFNIISKEATLKGCLGHDREDIEAAIEIFLKKKVDVTGIISEIVPLKELQNIFERFLDPSNRNFIKILVEV